MYLVWQADSLLGGQKNILSVISFNILKKVFVLSCKIINIMEIYHGVTKNGNEYLNKIANRTVASMTDAIEIMDGAEIVGIAKVTVALVTVEGKKWVRIESIGTLTGETIEVKTVMRIDITNPINVVMERS